MEQKDLPGANMPSNPENLTSGAQVPTTVPDPSFSAPMPVDAVPAAPQVAGSETAIPSFIPADSGVNEQQPIATLPVTPVAIGEQQFQPAHFDSTKKFTKNIVRTVVGHTLAIVIVGLGGWFVWQWSGIFGVHYKEVGRPYLTMQQSLSSVSFALIDSYPHAVYESSASSALKTDENYKDMTTSVAKFDKATAELEKFKAFKHGEVSESLQSIARKNKRYSTYVKARAESYKVVQGAVDTCGDISYRDSDAQARYVACKQKLSAIKDADISDKQFKAFFAGYKKYTNVASDLATAYAAKTSTWSEVFKASNDNDDEFRELRDATRIKLRDDEEKLNPREEIKTTADKLADLIEAEKGSQH